MPTPTEMLTELKDRLASLPEQVAESVARSQASTSAPAAPEALDSIRQAVQDVSGQAPAAPPGMAPAAPPMLQSPAMPPAAPSSPWTQPGPPEAPDVAAQPLPPPPLPAGGDGPALPPPQPGIGQAMPPTLGGAGGGEVVDLLTQIHATLSAGGPRGIGPGREPPQPLMIPAPGRIGQFAEGYAGGASPSMDVSNIAGSGGASSRRGYGTNATGGRYWQPEDEGVPR